MRAFRFVPSLASWLLLAAGLACVGALSTTAAAQQAPAAADAPPTGQDAPDAGAPASADGQAAPAPSADEPRCGWCKTTGKLPFEADPKWVVEDDTGPGWKIEFCSEAIGAENMGLDWEPCSRCKSPTLKAAAVAEYEALRKKNDAWLAEVRKLDNTAQVEEPLVHVRSTHFWIATDMPKISTSDKKTYKTHELAHLYVRRLEALYARFQSMFHITDAQNMRNTHLIFLFERQGPAFKAAPVYSGLSIENASSVRRAGGGGKDSIVVGWWDKGIYPKDQDMYRHQIHLLIHQLTAILYDPTWFKAGEKGLSPPWLNDKYGWLDEGLAHWFEIDFDKKASTYCFREQDTTSRWGSDDWRANIYKAVIAGDKPAFSDVSVKPSESLSAKEHQFAWSWVDYLMSLDQAAMGKALELCKRKVPARDILKEAWGINMLTFETDWATWVEDHYSPTSKR